MARGRPSKKRRLSPPMDESKKSETVHAKNLFSRAAEWDLEEAYEQRPRKKQGKENTRLPIKTAEGKIEEVERNAGSDSEVDSFLESASEGGNNADEDTPPTDEIDNESPMPLREQIIAAKEELAKTALLLNEDPEEHVGAFKSLGNIAQHARHPTIKKLALVTQAAVYRDVIPGYRIRAYKDEEVGKKVSKDVRQLRQYEQGLVTGYQNYVKDLSYAARSKSRSEDISGVRTTAISCACTLLTSVPHFNFRTELLKIITDQLSASRSSPDFQKCIDTIETFYTEDDDGAPSLEAVGMIAKVMKAKHYRFQEQVLNTFLRLRLLTELSAKGSTLRTDRLEDETQPKRVSKKGWQHRSKKERKIIRERKAVEKDFKEADASVNYEARERMQSETLKLVFTTYFRILKQRVPDLMGAVLEGLAKFAHLINQDFFGDLLEALKDLVTQAEAASQQEEEEEETKADENEAEDADSSILTQRNYTREALLSTQTAFTLLSQQEVSKSASSLSLDLSFFTTHIYRTLYSLTLSPDLELGPKSLHLSDPNSHIPTTSANQINVSTPFLLLLRILHSILLPLHKSSSTISPTLLASFTKRICTASLQTPEKSTLATLSLLQKILQKHGNKISPLWFSEERKGDGVFRGDADTIEGTGVWSGGNIWEGELLRLHYCPKVREGVKDIDGMVKELA